MTDQEIETMANKIAEVAPDQVATFLSNPDAFDYNILEGYSDFTDKYKNVADFIIDKPKIMSELYQQFDGKFPGEARLYSLSKKYPWLNTSELKEWFDKTNEYKKMYEAEREAEAGKTRRKQEIDKEWFLQNLLASDYSKQRYIDDPNASVFGKEGSFDPSSTQGQEELQDVILGGTGAVADLIPGAGALIAPTIRTGRDVLHYFSDSPYKKSVRDIGRDAALDYGINTGAWLLANARKGAKAATELSSNDVKRAVNLANENNAIHEGLGMVEATGASRIQSLPEILSYRNMGVANPINDIKLKNLIMDMPESSMKQELMPLVADIKKRPINRAEVNEIIQKYQKETNPAYQANLRAKLKQDKFLPEDARYGSPYLERAITTKPVSELKKLEQASYLFNRLSAQVNKGKLGQMLVQEGATVTGRTSGKPNVVETALQKKEREDSIERIINNYSLLWNKKSPPPEAKESPLIKAAWERWSKE